MTIELSETASNAMLDVLGGMMDGGRIEVQTGDGKTLAVLKLSDPAAMPASGSELEFNQIALEDAALASGTAISARIVAANGSEIFACDVGDENSDAVIKLSTNKLRLGVPMRLSSFRLVMR